MNEQEDYAPIDSDLSSWEALHGITFDRWSKGYATRSVWIDGKVQVWLDAPDEEGYVLVHAAELKPSLPSKWGRRIQVRITLDELAVCLDEVWSKGHSWL